MAVPRPRPPYLVNEPNRHGRPRWYVKLPAGLDGKRKRTRIKGEYGSDAFMAAYRAAIGGAPINTPAAPGAPAPKSVAWLIAEYRKSDAWKNYSHGTKKQREPILTQIIATAGDDPIEAMTRGAIVKGRDKRADTPSQSDHFMETVRKLFEWALEAQHVPHDPTAGIKNIKRKKSAGFPPWGEEDVQTYEQHWQLGTKERVWMAVILYSGLRRSDAVRLGRQHRRTIIIVDEDGKPKTIDVHVIKIKKADELIEVTLPILPELQQVLDAGPIGDLAYIVGARGRPYVAESFGNMFADACIDAGVGMRAHGLRKLGATRAANNGATTRQLQALFAWIDYKMPTLYTRTADRRRLGAMSGHMLGSPAAAVNEIAPAMSAPNDKVRTLERKPK